MKQLFARVQNVQTIEKDMDNSKHFKTTVKVITTVCNILGFNFLKRNFKWNLRTAHCLFTASFCAICLPYTVYYYRNQFVICLKFLSTAPEVLQAALKMYSVLRYHKLLASTFQFLERVYSLNANAGLERTRALLKCARIQYLSVRVGAVSLIFIYIIGCTPPLYSYFVLNKKELFFEVLVPGYPPNTNTKYIVTLVFQFVAFTTGFSFNNIADFTTLILIIHLSLLTDLFLAAMKELAEDFAKLGHNVFKLRKSLKNCVLMHQDLINYISVLNAYTSPIFFCQISTASLSLAVNCFCMVKTDWVGAYAFGLFTFIKIFMICTLGTFVEVMSDRITTGIYNCPWHCLPADCRKTIFLLLLRSQNFTKFTIAGTVPLNIATGASIMKAIYSYLMLLLSLDT